METGNTQYSRAALLDAGVAIEDVNELERQFKVIGRETQKLEEYKKNNPIEFFSPNPPQLDFWIAYLNPQYTTFAYTGGNRRGKTTIGGHLAIVNMIGYIPYKLECKNNDGVLIRGWESVYEDIKKWEGKTWELIWKNGIPLVKLIFAHDNSRMIRYVGQGWEDHVRDVVIPCLEKWWPKSIPVEIRKNQNGLKVYWLTPKGHYLRIMSNDQPSRKFEGKEDDLVILDEPPKLDNYIALRRGVVDRQGRLFLGATLLATEIWVDRQIVKAKMEDGTLDPRIFRSEGEMADNLGFGIKNQKAIDDFGDELMRLKPEDYDARIKGRPSYLAGIVYGMFEANVHVKKHFPVPLDWIVDIAIDPHPKEPQAVLFLATDPKGFKYVVDEIWEHADPKSLAELIIRKTRRNNYRVINSVIIDPHSKGDSNNPESVFEIIENNLMAYGMGLDPATKGVDCVNDGIIVVKDWLMTQNKAPALFFFDTCVRTIWEIEGWLWNPKTKKPVDADDHMMENLRRLIQLGSKWQPKRKRQGTSLPTNWRIV